MTDKELAAALLSSAQIGFDNILFELKDILRIYRDRLEDMDYKAANEAVEEARLLARTVEYKQDQLSKLNSEIEAYWRIVLHQGGETCRIASSKSPSRAPPSPASSWTACNNIPLPVVQSIVGHASPAMTKIYMDHASQADKQRFMDAMPDLLSGKQERPKIPIADIITMIKNDAPKNAILAALKQWA